MKKALADKKAKKPPKKEGMKNELEKSDKGNT